MDPRMTTMMSGESMAMPGMNTIDMEVLQACIDACAACEQACAVCAVQEMSCAPACMNCADMCHTMMRALLRMQGMTPAAMMSMLDACIAVCEMCEDECLEHAAHSVVCEMCAQACRACADACMALKDAMSMAA
jgi:fructose/tagatose bisphosphate aldolase